jgi:hypothetical protein
MIKRRISIYPIPHRPELWDVGYRGFWQAWLQGNKVVALLRIGDWRQP